MLITHEVLNLNARKEKEKNNKPQIQLDDKSEHRIQCEMPPRLLLLLLKYCVFLLHKVKKTAKKMMAPPLHASTPSSIANSHYKEARAVQLWHQPRKKTIIILQVDDEL